MNYFKEILKFAIPYKSYGIANIISNIFYALFGTLSFISLMPVMNVLFDQTKQVFTAPVWTGLGGAKDYMENYVNYYVTEVVQNDHEKALIIMIGLVMLLFFLKNIASYAGMYFITILRNGVLRDLRRALYGKIVDLPISYFSEKRKGDVISRATADVQLVQNSFLTVLELVVKEPLNIIFALAAMLILSVKLTLFVLIFIPISGYLISALGKRLKKQSDKVQREQGLFLSILEETLGGLKVIKGFNAEERVKTTFDESTQRYYDYNTAMQNRSNIAAPVSEFLGIGVIGVLLWFGGNMVIGEQTMEGGTFISFMALAYGILTPAKAISKAVYSVKQANAAAERVIDVLNTKNEIADTEHSIKINTFAEAIEIKNVNFTYDKDPVLKNFSLTINKGETVALVGQSGSGKSTIANLLTRFYDVNDGTISIDGVNIKDASLHSLRDQMAIVTQDSILFNDTVAVNVALSDKNATDEQVISALKIANAWEFVSELPLGIHTNIGDSGNKLSGGQKQRLSIARAVLKNAPILILDEATSALDTESERLVQDALEKVMRNRTSIVIAHRLSTIQNADKIIVMRKGEIVEQGRHQDLLEVEGLYSNLVSMQSL